CFIKKIKSKMKKAIALMAIVWLPVWLLAQNITRIEVKDAITNELLIGASIRIKGTPLNGQTNSQGQIQLAQLKPGTHTLQVSYMGYRPLEKVISIPQDQFVSVSMEPSNFLAEEVVVQATRASNNAATTFKNLSREEIAKNNL